MIKLENLFIGIMLFGAVFVFMTDIYSQMAFNYGVSPDLTYLQKYNNTGSSLYLNAVDPMKSNLQLGSVSETDSVNNMIAGGYNSVRTGPFDAISRGWTAFNTLISDSQFIDPKWSILLTSIMTTILIISLIYLMFRFRFG